MTTDWRADVSGSLREDFGCTLASVPVGARMEVMFRGDEWIGRQVVGDARVYGLGRLKPFVRRRIIKTIKRQWDLKPSTESPILAAVPEFRLSFRIATIKAMESAA